MAISFFSLFGKKEKPEYFLALLLRDDKASAVVFEKLLGKIQIVGQHDESFGGSIEDTSLDNLLEILDKTISNAESTLPPNIETQKTVFGVKENWVEDVTSTETGSKIKKDYLLKLKKISEALNLIPIGFLVIHEAISYFLQKEEGAPVSAILVEISSDNIAVSILKAGRIIGTKRAKIEDSVAKTTDKVLHHFPDCEVLPSRLIIFNGKNNDHLQQEFIGHSWSKSLPFLHVPQINILPLGLDAKAVLSGAATQMGLEIAGEETPVLSKKHELKHEKEIEKETLSKEEVAIDEEEEKQEETLKEEISMEDFGFIKEKDVKETPVKKVDIKEKDEVTEVINTPVTSVEKTGGKSTGKIILFFGKLYNTLKLLSSKISQVLKKVLNRKNISGFSLQIPFAGNKKIIFIPLIIIIFICSTLLLYFYGLKSTITITLNPKVLERDQSIVFSTNSPSDFSKNIINADPVSVSEEGTLSTPATGKKEIGEKAKGTVTIYNSNLAEGKTFSKGTAITSSNNFEFTLDSSVTVASASGDASGITPSTAKASVTAEKIGKEHNLPSGTKFSVNSQPSTIIIAKNDVAFSGGSKKEVTAVSKADLDKLLSELPKSLEEKARSELSKDLPSDKTTLPSFVKTSLVSKDFDKKLNEETDTVTLKATISYQGIIYKTADIDELSKKYIQDNIQDMVISKNGITSEIKDIQSKNEKEIKGVLHLKSFLLPKIDTEKTAKELAGKSFDETRNTILKFPQVEDVNIVLNPQIPFLPKLLPRSASNITFIIESNE